METWDFRLGSSKVFSSCGKPLSQVRRVGRQWWTEKPCGNRRKSIRWALRVDHEYRKLRSVDLSTYPFCIYPPIGILLLFYFQKFLLSPPPHGAVIERKWSKSWSQRISFIIILCSSHGFWSLLYLIFNVIPTNEGNKETNLLAHFCTICTIV